MVLNTGPTPPDLLKGSAKAGAAVQKRGCAGCHSSTAESLAGSAGGKGSAANLTPDEKTGLGGWKDEDIISAIRDGIDDEQRTLCSSMPRFDVTDEEALNIVAYLPSLTPVANEAAEAASCASAADAVVEAQHCTACRRRCALRQRWHRRRQLGGGVRHRLHRVARPHAIEVDVGGGHCSTRVRVHTKIVAGAATAA